MPVLPDVPSIMVPPGLILPACSAASSIAMPMRSFTLPPGLRYSSFASIVGRTPCAIRLSRTRGVLPMTSRMSLCHIRSKVLRYHKHFLHPGLHTGESLHGRRHWKVADVDVLHATLDQSMHAPRADLVGMDIACKVARQFVNRNWKKLREHCECLWTRASIVENAEDSGNFHA